VNLLDVEDRLSVGEQLLVLCAFLNLCAFFIDSELDVGVDLGDDAQGVLETGGHVQLGCFVCHVLEILNRIVLRKLGDGSSLCVLDHVVVAIYDRTSVFAQAMAPDI
jgi:hypothetical protein